jgi:hypothetical protein
VRLIVRVAIARDEKAYHDRLENPKDDYEGALCDRDRVARLRIGRDELEHGPL